MQFLCGLVHFAYIVLTLYYIFCCSVGVHIVGEQEIRFRDDSKLSEPEKNGIKWTQAEEDSIYKGRSRFFVRTFGAIFVVAFYMT